jgi:CheY-like chemotaxis protein
MSNLSDWNVLVIEDEPDGQDVITQILDLYHIATEVTATAEDGLARLREADFSAVIIDLNLPRMDGIELIRKVRAHEVLHSLPCIAITAYHTSAVKQQALASGFDAYFAKPLDDTAFVRELERVVAGR